jgi:hypothetical protein
LRKQKRNTGKGASWSPPACPEEREPTLKLDLPRRREAPIAWARAFKELARTRGVGDRLRGKGGRAKVRALTAAALARELGVAPRTARYRFQLSDILAAHPDLAERVDRGEMSAKQAVWLAREREAANLHAARRTPGPTRDQGCVIEHLDFRSLELEPGNVDLVLCDLPRDGEGAAVFADLSKFAARALRPGGLLLAFVGQLQVHAAMDRLGESLDYGVVGGTLLADPSILRPGETRTRWKLLLVFGKPPSRPGYRAWLADLFEFTGAARDLPLWQQSLPGLRYYIENLTQPGGLVVDPFVGTGATAVAARQLGRRFIGCALDAAAVKTARERLAVTKPLSRASVGTLRFGPVPATVHALTRGVVGAAGGLHEADRKQRSISGVPRSSNGSGGDSRLSAVGRAGVRP